MSKGAECPEALRLGDEIRAGAAALHAATAQLVGLIGELDAVDGWQGYGIRSLPHWLSIEAGFDLATGARLAGLAESLKSLPVTAAAFAEGRLSADKARLVSRVATPADEAIWVETALNASGNQLTRIVRDVARTRPAGDVP